MMECPHKNIEITTMPENIKTAGPYIVIDFKKVRFDCLDCGKEIKVIPNGEKK